MHPHISVLYGAGLTTTHIDVSGSCFHSHTLWSFLELCWQPHTFEEFGTAYTGQNICACMASYAHIGHVPGREPVVDDSFCTSIPSFPNAHQSIRRWPSWAFQHCKYHKLGLAAKLWVASTHPRFLSHPVRGAASPRSASVLLMSSSRHGSKPSDCQNASTTRVLIYIQEF